MPVLPAADWILPPRNFRFLPSHRTLARKPMQARRTFPARLFFADRFFPIVMARSSGRRTGIFPSRARPRVPRIGLPQQERSGTPSILGGPPRAALPSRYGQLITRIRFRFRGLALWIFWT